MINLTSVTFVLFAMASASRMFSSGFCYAFLKPQTFGGRSAAGKAISGAITTSTLRATRQFTPGSYRFGVTATTARYASSSTTSTTTATGSVNGGEKYKSSTVVHREKPLDVLKDPNRLSTAAQANLTILDTNLAASPAGEAMLDGLDVYMVPALEDHHPLAVYGIDSLMGEGSSSNNNSSDRYPILLLHGRTWSSVPVYHLLGGDQSNNPIVQGEEVHDSRSTMELLVELGLQPYAMDWRGFGGTPQDATGYVEPHRCVQDVETVLLWIAQRHGIELEAPADGGCAPVVGQNVEDMPALLGWSQGALVAQLAAQAHHNLMSKLILYGSIYDPLVRYPREPLYQVNQPNTSQIINTFNDAIEDFTVQGSIPPEPARVFAEKCLVSDPIKAVWKHLYQFNNCDPARVNVPTLVVAGDQDPYAPLHVQQDLFSNLARGSDRTWSILADADHAAHLLDEAKERFAAIATSFVTNGKRGNPPS